MRIPDKKPPEVRRRTDLNMITETRRYRLITPLFGGGVETQEADPITVVRATEVRGHLRFWWRAVNANRFQDVDTLRKRECEVWGSTDIPSAVQIDLPKPGYRTGVDEIAFRVREINGKLKTVTSPKVAEYAAFPLLPDKDEQRQKGWISESVRLDVEFSLRLTFPEGAKNDVQGALWAWQTFGGIGARTRRGFGALQRLDKESLQPSEVEGDIRETLARLTSRPGSSFGVPSLSSGLRLKLTRPYDDPIDAWKHLISRLFKFRQNRYENKYGLSKWPEANEIRRLHGVQTMLPDGESNARLIQAFPRAAFGLPIIFHMPHDDDIQGDLTLEGEPDLDLGKKYDRLASPLILRPLACAGGKYVGLAAILDAPSEPPKGLSLKGAPGNPAVSSGLTHNEAQQIDPLNGTVNVLQAFLNWL